jgi:hypothetical protein
MMARTSLKSEGQYLAWTVLGAIAMAAALMAITWGAGWLGMGDDYKSALTEAMHGSAALLAFFVGHIRGRTQGAIEIEEHPGKLLFVTVLGLVMIAGVVCIASHIQALSSVAKEGILATAALFAFHTGHHLGKSTRR